MEKSLQTIDNAQVQKALLVHIRDQSTLPKIISVEPLASMCMPLTRRLSRYCAKTLGEDLTSLNKAYGAFGDSVQQRSLLLHTFGRDCTKQSCPWIASSTSFLPVCTLTRCLVYSCLVVVEAPRCVQPIHGPSFAPIMPRVTVVEGFANMCDSDLAAPNDMERAIYAHLCACPKPLAYCTHHWHSFKMQKSNEVPCRLPQAQR